MGLRYNFTLQRRLQYMENCLDAQRFVEVVSVCGRLAATPLEACILQWFEKIIFWSGFEDALHSAFVFV